MRGGAVQAGQHQQDEARHHQGLAQPQRQAQDHRGLAGGLPAQRNHLDLRDILSEVYHTEAGLAHGGIPNDPELPLPLNEVHPIHEVVKVDYFLPGCPPPADAIWKFLTDLIAGRTPRLGHGLLRYD